MNIFKQSTITLVIIVMTYLPSFAQTNYYHWSGTTIIIWLLFLLVIVPILMHIVANFMAINVIHRKTSKILNNLDETIKYLDPKYKKVKKCEKHCPDLNCKNKKILTISLMILTAQNIGFGQTKTDITSSTFWTQSGIVITVILILIPILIAIAYVIAKAKTALRLHQNYLTKKKAFEMASYLGQNENQSSLEEFVQEQYSDQYTLSYNELSGVHPAKDEKGLIQYPNNQHDVHYLASKKKNNLRPKLDADITKLILWYIGCAAVWLVIGTGVGEYLGIKFVSPEADSVSWLSFGRLRPVHTNIVFWGWASLGMIGLGYYVVPTVSNTKIYNITWGWIALVLTNLMVTIGTICLMAGINNGGGEFREYIWPVMSLFAVALILTLINFLMTVAKRDTKEIYISNWYIVSAIIFTIIVALTAYLPFWQDGISETIVQGYFMHSGVGMWFTLYTLGLMYYFIPQQINKPIYSYSLGILAFWTQIIFYTIIGTHHFIFAPIPWWLQTVGIVGSMGMIIPVVAATINFTMTFKGQWHKVSNSYTLPFFFVGVMYYFIVSLQGTAEAFKFTNLLWHFTDFTVAHAHLGFYGIITFVLWGGIYAIVPRLTGKEPSISMVGVHFWLAFVGILFYTIPLSIGATLRGLMWMEGKPFIDSVVIMFDWWLWRAIGGSIMFVSHILFLYNFVTMTKTEVDDVDITEEIMTTLVQQKR